MRRFLRRNGSGRARPLALLLVLLFPLAAALALRGSAAEIMFTVVNNQVLDLNQEYQPIVTSRQTYIPHFVLTRTSLGVTSTWSSAQRYFTLTKGGKSITFEIGSGVAFDNEKQYDQRCTRVRTGGDDLFYLPLGFICEYFGFSVRENVRTDYGTMVRITSGKALEEKSFLSLFDSVIAMKVQEWIDANLPSLPPPPSPSGAAFPTPPPSVFPSPSPPSPPSPSPSPSPREEPRTVFVTFEGGPNSFTEGILDILDARGVRAAFFLRGDQIPLYAGQVRRIAAGHTAGLSGYDGDAGRFFSSSEEMLAQLERGNEALCEATFTKTFLARLPGGSAGQLTAPMRDALVAAGYRYWDWTIDASARGSKGLTGYVLSRLPRDPRDRGSVVLMLPQDEAVLSSLDDLLRAIQSDNYLLLGIDPSGRPINFAQDLCLP